MCLIKNATLCVPISYFKGPYFVKDNLFVDSICYTVNQGPTYCLTSTRKNDHSFKTSTFNLLAKYRKP